MRRTTDAERRRAIRRGMEFIYSVAKRPCHFDEYGSDLLSCFYYISRTSDDAGLRRQAREMGEERARRWRRVNARLPADADADTVNDLVQGSMSATGLGFPDEAFDSRLKKAVGRFTATDFLGFDPTREPPPPDVPELCECGLYNKRGRKRCVECRRRLEMASPYRTWYYGLIWVYTSELFGAPAGARYADMLKWLPELRPYRGPEGGENPDFYDTVYAVTHLIYTLNDYSLLRLSPRWLPEEFAFLKANMREAIEWEDPETLGEFMDALRAFGLEETHPLIRRGIDCLLSWQNPDGSWGDMDEEDVYHRYHPTWTAIDGLREYRWRGRGLCFPEILPTLRAWARKQEPGCARPSQSTGDGLACS
jgi:hypothetical protein